MGEGWGRRSEKRRDEREGVGVAMVGVGCKGEALLYC